MILNLTGLDESGEGRCASRSSIWEPSLYLDVAVIGSLYFKVPENGAQRPKTNECGCIAPDPPYYKCTRDWRHEEDHAAHGGYKNAEERMEIKMFARWARGTGDESPRLRREAEKKR